MKLTVLQKRHRDAQGAEVIVIAWADRAGAQWQPAIGLRHSHDWHRNEQISLGGHMAPGLVGNSGASLRLPGARPVLLVLAHPWSGVAEFSTGRWNVEVDLYSSTTTTYVLDPAGGIAVEVDPSMMVSGNSIGGVASGGIDILPDAIRIGRSFRPMHSAHAWPRRARDGRHWLQRRPFFEIRLALGWLLSRAGVFFAPGKRRIREDLLWAITDGLSRRGPATALSPAQYQDVAARAPDPGADHQIAVLAAIVEGLASRVEQLSAQFEHTR